MGTVAGWALLFPGQGAQYVGMGRELYERVPAARSLYDQAADILGYDLAEICFSGPQERLDSTIYSQPAIYVTSLAALESLRAEQRPCVAEAQWAAGLSLGEYSALTFAGAMRFEQALRVVQIRGEAMQAASDARSSGMLSVLGPTPDRVAELCAAARREGDVLEIANLLCPGNTVISGDRDACDRAAEMAKAYDAIRATPLAVAGAFHTSIMEPAVERLQAALADVELSAPRIPVFSNVDAETHEDPDEIRGLLVQQVCAPVRWEESMRALRAAGAERFCEVGPGRVLRGLLKRIERRLTTEGTLD